MSRLCVVSALPGGPGEAVLRAIAAITEHKTGDSKGLYKERAFSWTQTGVDEADGLSAHGVLLDTKRGRRLPICLTIGNPVGVFLEDVRLHAGKIFSTNHWLETKVKVSYVLPVSQGLLCHRLSSSENKTDRDIAATVLASNMRRLVNQVCHFLMTHTMENLIQMRAKAEARVAKRRLKASSSCRRSYSDSPFHERSAVFAQAPGRLR